MGEISKIEWTNSTWNPVTGCSKVSAGCKNCYAQRLALRLEAMGNPRYAHGFEVRLQPDLLRLPIRWTSPRMIFVNSMSDLFHEEVPETFIHQVFATIHQAHWHQFQILTKRADRLAALAPKLPWPPNLWQGVSVENAVQLGRIRQLQEVPAAVRFVSFEPLLSRIPDLPINQIDWVIVGGESGPRARPVRADWVREIRDQCRHLGVAFFFKQWGGFFPKARGRRLDGREWNEMPGHHLKSKPRQEPRRVSGIRAGGD